jgi:single-strand DNA-binding protein
MSSGIEAACFGLVVRDAELKTSQGGKQYLRLTVRIGDGDAVQWVRVMAFDQQAIERAEKMVKGARVYVEGRLSLDEWTGQDGEKRHGLSVLSWHCRLSEIGRNKPRRPRTERQNSPSLAPAGDGFHDDALPF